MPPGGESDTRCDHIPAENKRKLYCLMSTYMDDLFGEMVAHLKNTDDPLYGGSVWDNSVILLTSDNGGMPPAWSDPSNEGITKSYGCNYPLRGGKLTDGYEGATRVFAALGGGRIPQNKNGGWVKTPFHMID